MDDEVASPLWQLDPDTRAQLRIERVRAAAAGADWAEVVLEAEELLDEEPEHVEALGMLATALLELGDVENAAEAFDEHLRHAPQPEDAEGRIARAEMLSGLALARFEACDPHGAIDAAREAVRLSPGLAEAHYTLGLALERLPDGKAEASRAFASARTLDPDAYPWPLRLDDAAILAALRRARDAAHPRIRAFWDGVPVALEDEPSLAELRQHPPPLPPTVAGLYAGSPPADPDLATRPESLRLFRKNLARSRSLEDVERQLGRVLEQEALDWLGVDLDELESLP